MAVSFRVVVVGIHNNLAGESLSREVQVAPEGNGDQDDFAEPGGVWGSGGVCSRPQTSDQVY